MDQQTNRTGFDAFKSAVVSKLGVPDYYSHDKGDYPARVNGFVGGNSVRSLQHLAHEYLNSISEAEGQSMIDKFGLDVLESDIEKTHQYMQRFS